MRHPPAVQPVTVRAFLRVSTGEQGRTGTSLDGQRVAIAEWCAAKGFPAPTYYVEIESGSDAKIEARTEQLRLQREAQPGDLVLVTKLDRWSRDIPHAVSTVRTLIRKGVGWFAIWMNLDASTREGDDRLGQEAVYAERERKVIYERTVLRKAELNRSGHYTKGNVPPGYERARQAQRPHPIRPSALAPLVLELFTRSDRGTSIDDLTAWAHGLGHRWHKQTVGRMLRDRTYIGEVKVLLGGGTWVAGKHEPIIPRDLFERVQVALDGRRKGGRRPSADARTATWLLRGLATCGLCGGRMGSAYGALLTTNYYACAAHVRRAACPARRVRVEIVDAEVADAALARLVELRAELARAPVAGPAPVAHAHVGPTVEERRQGLARRRAKVIDMAEHGTIDDAEMVRRLARVDAERGRLEIEAAEQAREVEKAGGAVDPVRRRKLLADIVALSRAWGRMGRPEQREVLRRLACSVTLECGETPVIAWRSVADLLVE